MFSKNTDGSSHVEKVEAVRYSEALNIAAMHLLDLEVLYHYDFIHGFDTLDQMIVRNCKRKMSIALHTLNLFNLFLKHADFKLVRAGNNLVLHLQELPRILLSFNPRSAKFTGESTEEIEKDNNRVGDAVEYINNIISNTECHDIVDVRSRYTTDEDGFLIAIKLGQNLTEAEFIRKIETFIEEAQSLSLDELMISQQFSDWYTLQHKNPFWLHQKKEATSQSILISIFNVHCFSPSYFLATLLDNIKIKVLSKLKGQPSNSDIEESSHKLQIQDQYSSINNSFVILNFELELTGKHDD
jgi:hypothetical protein